MALEPKYVTPDFFREYSGEDLGAVLKGDANPSDKANAFLYRLEGRVGAFLASHFLRDPEEEWPRMSEYQRKMYREALCEQAIYTLRNSEIITDSGYDPESGVVATRDQLVQLSIAPACQQKLELCGLWCRHIRGFRKGGAWDDWVR